MKKFIFIIKHIITVFTGLIWGVASFFWIVYSILFLGNLMEEPGSYDYEYEGEPMRILGLIGLIFYIIVFTAVLLSIKEYKRYLIIFLISMVLGGVIPAIYIFILY